MTGMYSLKFSMSFSDDFEDSLGACKKVGG